MVHKKTTTKFCSLDAFTSKHLLEVALVYPSIGSILNSSVHRQCLMVSALIRTVGVLIQDTWPNQHLATFWHNSNIQLGKVSASTGFNIVEVQKHSQNPIALCSACVHRNIVMMFCVEFSLVVLEKLQIFRVFVRDASQIFDSRQHLLGQFVFVACLQTPSIFGRSTRMLVVSKSTIRPLLSNIHRLFVAPVCTEGNQSLTFFFGQKVFQRNNPGPIQHTLIVRVTTGFGVHRNAVLFLVRFIGHDAFKHTIEISLLEYIGFLISIKGTSLIEYQVVTHSTGWGTFLVHVAGIRETFAEGCPFRALLVFVLTSIPHLCKALFDMNMLFHVHFRVLEPHLSGHFFLCQSIRNLLLQAEVFRHSMGIM
mmetsp:Transcript_32631/g.75070  ORF Transcript_32631/g.75070 Transcript_32631/m.75070 type:complete len:366 (+) Transcript_32631:76-1173(+)